MEESFAIVLEARGVFGLEQDLFAYVVHLLQRGVQKVQKNLKTLLICGPELVKNLSRDVSSFVLLVVDEITYLGPVTMARVLIFLNGLRQLQILILLKLNHGLDALGMVSLAGQRPKISVPLLIEHQEVELLLILFHRYEYVDVFRVKLY